MGEITKPVLLDETGQDIVEGLSLIARRIAEAGQSFYYELRVLIATDSVCRATTGAKVVEAVSVNGEAVLCLDQLGSWTVTGETPEGTKMITEYVSASAPGVHYLTARFQGIYGVSWPRTATAAWSRTDDAIGFDDPIPYVNDGTMTGADCYSPFDTIAPWSAISVVEDEACGSLVAIPKFWYKWTFDQGQIKLQIAAYPEEGFSVSPAHMDRGDGKGERDVVYIGRYHCAADMRSTTGVKPAASKTRAVFRSAIHGLGEDVWQIDYATRVTIWMLYLVEFANWDSQRKIGAGCGNSTGTEEMGYTDSMPYHTGTTQASRTEYGLGTQYRWIEGLWDNVCDWVDGIYFAGSEVYGILNPAEFSDTANGTLLCNRPAAEGYISDWQQPAAEGYGWMIYPSAVSGSASSFCCDYCAYSASGVVLCGGGNYNRNANHGLFCLSGYLAASGAGGSIGSRLLKLP